jgi:uncharacterized protein with PIN domain
MIAFIDTSSLFKKYVEEGDYQALDSLLKDISEIIISPITALEFNSVILSKADNCE